MAKKQTRRSISVSRATYERLKSFCEMQNISMSQFVENRVGDFLQTGDPAPVTPRPIPPRASLSTPPRPAPAPKAQTPAQPPAPTPARAATPMSSAAARYAVEPPPPIIKPRDPGEVKPPTAPTADQIFTF